MALDRTSGYDMIVQISETELNNQLATAFLAGLIIPPSMDIPVNVSGLIGNASLNFQTPIADLDRPRPRMGITIPFVNSQLSLTAPIPIIIAPLGGRITIIDDLQIDSNGSTQTLLMNFNAGAPSVSVVFDTASEGVLAPLLEASGLTLAIAQNLIAGTILSELQTNLQQIELSPPIPVADDIDPTSIYDIDVTTINDPTTAD
ncbi:MAG: hypothetical protein WAU01_09625, partial [Saprospiraceae bacterium]